MPLYDVVYIAEIYGRFCETSMNFYRPHGIVSQKTEIFIMVTVPRTLHFVSDRCIETGGHFDSF
jgi:hypothetical protein